MTSGNEHTIEDSALFDALRPSLPAADAMADRVRTRLAAHASGTSSAADDSRKEAPRGAVLRFADWTGLRGVAASIVGPLLLPLGLARAGAVGTLAAKGLLPKSLLSAVALPFAVLMVIGLTLRSSLRRTTDLQGDAGPEPGSPNDEAAEALAHWWNERRIPTVAFAGALVLVNLASYSTAKVLLFLAGLIAHSLCVEVLSAARQASRHAVAMAAFRIGMTVYITGSMVVIASDTVSVLFGMEPSRPEFHHFVLDVAVTLWGVGVLALASTQGRSRFLGPWRLMTEGTDLDLLKLGGLVLVLAATPGLAFAQWFHFREQDGSIGERLWESRASLAWLGFCLHALILVRRAPVGGAKTRPR